MADMVVHKASELKPQTRAAIEAEFGRPLRDDEEVSIAARGPGEAAENVRMTALRRLEAHYARMDEKTKDLPEQEIEQILLEAIRSVHPTYEERR